MDRVPVIKNDWGRARALLFLCVLIVGSTRLGRWRAVEQDPETGASAIIEANSAWRMRRIALALESTRLGQWDSYLSFPQSAGSLSLPIYDHLVGLGLRIWSAGALGDPASALDETLLMRGALGVGPLLGGFLALAIFVWTRSVLGVGRRNACLGALLACAAPCSLSAAQPGSLEVKLLAVFVLLAASAAVSWMLRARSALDRFTFAMIAGGLLGVGLSTSALFLIPIAGVWSAALLEALRCDGETRAEWVRALLLFWISVVLAGLLPALGGPWLPAQEGVIHEWTQLCLQLALAGGLPFLALLWFPAWSPSPVQRRNLRGVLILFGVLALSLAKAFGPDRGGLPVLFASVGLDGDSPAGLASGTGLLTMAVFGLLALLQWARARGDEWNAHTVFLVVWGLGAGLAACVFDPAALFFVPLAAACLALAFERRPFAPGALALGALLALGAWDSYREHSQPDLEGLEALAAARSLRRTSDSPGAWNTIHPVQRWGVLADGRLAPLMAWYGHRPCASLGALRNGDRAGRAALLEALGAASYPEFERQAWELGLHWILWGSGSAQRLPASPAVSAALADRAQGKAAGSPGQHSALLLRIAGT